MKAKVLLGGDTLAALGKLLQELERKAEEKMDRYFKKNQCVLKFT